MNLNGDIIIIEDDIEDGEILIEVFEAVLKKNNYTNEIVLIQDPTTVIDYIRNTTEAPFLIISDLNMPRLNGFDLRQQIFDDLELNDKCVPYVFLTTSGDDPELMRRAYKLSVQGYFTKPNDYAEYEPLINDIVRYWKVAKLANRIY